MQYTWMLREVEEENQVAAAAAVSSNPPVTPTKNNISTLNGSNAFTGNNVIHNTDELVVVSPIKSPTAIQTKK